VLLAVGYRADRDHAWIAGRILDDVALSVVVAGRGDDDHAVRDMLGQPNFVVWSFAYLTDLRARDGRSAEE
jgi:hypothetical protein